MSEYGSTTIGKETQNLEIADAFAPYSGVRLSVGLDDDGNELAYFSGDETGRVLDVENPFGSQQMADNILASIQGFVYQPMYADGALLDPAAQIGDAVSVNDIYSRICVRATTFGTLMLSDVSSPASEEIVHEYNIPTPEERKFQRLNYDMKSEFKITNQAISAEVSARQSADSSLSGRIDVNATAITAEVTARQQAVASEASARQTAVNSEANARNAAVTELSGRIDVNATAITAKVSKNSPSGQTAFGWALSDSEWRVFNQVGNILRATSAGLEVKGKIQADEGYIGGESGFVIKQSAIYNGITTFGEDRSTGIYIGTDGIQLGNGFAVDSSGAVRASDLRIIGGAITIGEEGTTVQPVSVGDFTFYNWTSCPVNAVHKPYFEYPAWYDVSAVKQNGQIVSSSNYQKFGRTVTLKGDYLESLGTGTYPITVDVVEVHEPPDPIETGFFTCYNWSYTNGATTNLPYFSINAGFHSTRVSAYRGSTNIGILVEGEDYEITGSTVNINGYFLTHVFNAGTVLHFRVMLEDQYGSSTTADTADITIYAPGSSSTITAPNLVITAAEQIKYFEVTNSGAVTATDLTILGGSIRIGNNFVVDASGNLYAETGYFRGGVSAGNVQYGSVDGYFDGYGLTNGTVTNDEVDNAINASLGYANFSSDVFNGYDTATYLSCNYLKVLDADYVPTRVTFKVTNEEGTYDGRLTLTVLARA